MKKTWLLQSTAALAMFAVGATGAYAQSATSSGDIVVTAQKREQKLSDVGITMVAASSEQLQSAGISDVKQLTKITPGFSVGTAYGGNLVFSMRGVNFNAAQFSAAPAVSTYVDEAILPYSSMTGGLLLDVQRVEVLKGPQGTLFGQNSTGGSINVISNKPTNQLSYGVNGEVDNFGQVTTEGFVSGPINEQLKARLAASTTQGGGWQKGYYLNNRKHGDQNKAAFRLLLDWTPTDRLQVNLNLNANYDKGDIQQTQLRRVIPNNPANAAPGLIGYPVADSARDVELDPGQKYNADNRMYQSVLRVDYDLTDDLTFSSITNYLDFKKDGLHNLDSTALFILNDRVRGEDKTFAQEFRVNGKALDSKLNYTIGANYQKDKIFDGITLNFGNYSTIGAGTVFDNRYDLSNESKSVFASADYEIIPQLTLTGGIRYSDTKQTIDGCLYGNAAAAGLLGFIAGLLDPTAASAYLPGQCLTINNVPATPGGTPTYLPIVQVDAQKQDNISWRGGINFKPTDDSLIYGLVARGYKTGVYPVQSNLLVSTGLPVKQEQLTDYEAGVKLGLLDNKVRLNAAIFHYDYKDKQFFTYTPLPVVGSGSVLLNIPKSKVDGVEFDAVVNPVEGLTIRAAATYIKTKVGTFVSTNFQGIVTDVTGTEFNYAPPWSGTLDAEYRFPVASEIHAVVGASALWNSRTYGDIGEPALFKIPEYTTFDARVGLESEQGWRVGAFVRNLGNRYYITAAFPNGDNDSHYAGAPRTFGVNFGYTY